MWPFCQTTEWSRGHDDLARASKRAFEARGRADSLHKYNFNTNYYPLALGSLRKTLPLLHEGSLPGRRLHPFELHLPHSLVR